MASWLGEYPGIGQDSRFHWLPISSFHRSSKAAALHSLEAAQTVRPRQGFCSLCPRVGEGSQLTPGRVVLDSAIMKRPRPVQKNDANSSIKRESQIAQCQKTEGSYSAHFTDTIFSYSLQKTPQLSLPSVFGCQDEAGEIRRNLFYVNFESN